MNIIFKENAIGIDEKYVVLDLDTFSFPDGKLHTACCVVENIPITEMADTESLKDLHNKLLENYGKQNWNFCEQAIEQLKGKWNCELDSYYDDLTKRIDLFKNMTLGDDWSPIIARV